MGRIENTWLSTVAVFAIFNIPFICGLHLAEVKIPTHAIRDTVIRLECKYDLDPDEHLYSVKWYKDGHEFFRYVPGDDPPSQAFPLTGVNLDLENCTENTISLGPLSLASSGRYRCEVSGEAPLFQTVSNHGDLVVVALPEEGPKIHGSKSRYHINELVRLNCTSGPSKPVPILSWFVNGDPAEDAALRGPVVITDMATGLLTAKLGLEFRVYPKHFMNGDMKLKCLSTIATIYWRSNEESVEGERPQRAPALESRDSAVQAAADSRADRVQAGSNIAANSDRALVISSFCATLYFILSNSVR